MDQELLSHKVSLKGDYAGFASRFAAFTIDLVLLVSFSGVISWVIIATMRLINIDLIAPLSDTSSTLIRFVMLIGKLTLLVMPFFFMCAYWFFFWTVTGQTIGKRMMGVRVVRIDGERMTGYNSLRRIGMYVAGMIPFFFGFFWILLDEERRGWHDKFAGTCVIYSWDAREMNRFTQVSRPLLKPVENQAGTVDVAIQNLTDPID